LVLKLTYARRSILFPADIQQPAQAELLKWPSELRCDAMLAPHHGSGESTTAALIAAGDPLYIVSSNDRTLSQKQRVFERQIGKRELFRTNRCGATTITIDRAGGLTVTAYLSSDEAQ
jgi:competence protein ComEC